MTKILVAGGAGYIGSHTCLDLFGNGFIPVVYDNLSNGHAEFVKWGPLEVGDIRDRGKLEEVLRKHKPVAIVHFAAAIEVGQSVNDPAAYYDNNVSGTITLLRAAQAAGIDKIVFSSTCATYGIPVSTPMKESHPQLPINPYGRSKLVDTQGPRPVSNPPIIHPALFQGRRGRSGGKNWGMAFAKNARNTYCNRSGLGRRPYFELLGTDYGTRD